MRVIKNNTLRYEAFYKSLPYLSDVKELKNSGSEMELNSFSNKSKLHAYFDSLLSFQKKINNFSSTEEISSELDIIVKKIIPCKEVNLFILDETHLLPLNKGASEYSIDFVNKAYKNGILDWVFENDNPKIIPDLKLYNIKGSKYNYLVFPVIADNKNKGVLSILSSVSVLADKSDESKILQSIGSALFSRIEILRKEKELKASYNDQQIYQSKLFNDYKLSAIGELTNGVVEEILSPLQVIMSQVDFLKKENAEVREEDANSIKEQVKKVESIVNRLIKFAGINNENIMIHPCDLNKLIKDYYNLLSSTLKTINYEYYLDFAENLPPVLSHPSYVYQILTNIFSYLNSSGKKGGGILIQTRYKDKKVNIRIVLTDRFVPAKNKDDIGNYNLRIVNNLMKKHEGEFKILDNDSNGSIIVLTFPLQRKIRL